MWISFCWWHLNKIKKQRFEFSLDFVLNPVNKFAVYVKAWFRKLSYCSWLIEHWAHKNSYTWHNSTAQSNSSRLSTFIRNIPSVQATIRMLNLMRNLSQKKQNAFRNESNVSSKISNLLRKACTISKGKYISSWWSKFFKKIQKHYRLKTETNIYWRECWACMLAYFIHYVGGLKSCEIIQYNIMEIMNTIKLNKKARNKLGSISFLFLW